MRSLYARGTVLLPLGAWLPSICTHFLIHPTVCLLYPSLSRVHVCLCAHVPSCSCSTVGAIMMTPLLTKVLAGQLVPVDAAVSGP